MREWFKQLDRLLRGDATRLEALRGGSLHVPVRGLTVVGALLGVAYGICMGVFSLTGSGSHAHLQIFASAIKVPLLFFLTLGVTFPSLYVFNALMGSRLGLIAVLRLLVSGISIMMAVLSSLGPIVAFFSLTTSSYQFMTLLNVAVFATSGLLGGAFLLRTLQRMMAAAEIAAEEEARKDFLARSQAAEPPAEITGAPADPNAAEKAAAHARITGSIPPPIQSALDRPRWQPQSNVGIIFKIWVIVFGLVGGQMAWILRPFIGHPDLPFEFFRSTQSNFFQAVGRAIQNLFG